MKFSKHFKFNSQKNSFNKDPNETFESIFSIPKLVQKNKAIAFVLCILFGVFGIHRFYLGKFITGSLQLFLGLTCIWGNLAWVCFSFAIIDLLRIAFDKKFTKKLVFNVTTPFMDSNSQDNIYKTSPFSNFNDRESDEYTIRELQDDEVIITDSHPPRILQSKKNI